MSRMLAGNLYYNTSFDGVGQMSINEAKENRSKIIESIKTGYIGIFAEIWDSYSETYSYLNVTSPYTYGYYHPSKLIVMFKNNTYTPLWKIQIFDLGSELSDTSFKEDLISYLIKWKKEEEDKIFDVLEEFRIPSSPLITSNVDKLI